MQLNRMPVQVRANLQNASVSFATHDSKEYLVAPCVALVPGVLNGALVSLEAIEATYRAWNGRPVVLDHPYSAAGESISANSPEVLSHAGLGHTWNADIEGNRLRVQVWLDLEKCQRLGGDAQRVVDMVKSGAPVEVSTGYWANMKRHKGMANGREYDEVTELIIPDHLAMLPNAIGACNWADGCGIPRTNKGKSMDERTIKQMIMDTVKKLIPNMTVSDQFKALNTLVSQEMEADGVDSYSWHMIDIEGDYVVIGVRNTIQRRQFIQGENGAISLNGEWETVHQQTTFVPVANAHVCERCAVHINDDEAAEIPAPEVLEPTASDDPEPEGEPETQEDEPETEEVTVEVNEVKDTLALFLNELGASADEVKAAMTARTERRKVLYDVIKANTELGEIELSPLTDKALEQIAKTCARQQAEPQVTNVTDGTFVGRGMPNPGQMTENHGVPPRPQSLLKKVG